jgi:tetratricopeptide (TPR) repeat protein
MTRPFDDNPAPSPSAVISESGNWARRYPLDNELWKRLPAVAAEAAMAESAPVSISRQDAAPTKKTEPQGDANTLEINLAEWFRRGNASFMQKDYLQAIDCYRRALALSPGTPELHFNLGNTFLELKNWDEAIGCFQRTLALAPDFTDAHVNLGIAYYEQKSVERAIACYRRAIELAPDRADILYNLGLAFHDLLRLDDAVAWYRRALAVRPDFAEAHNNLGHALQERGELEAATDAYSRAVSHRPDYADAHYNLGRAHHLQHRPAEAIESYSKALHLRPDHHKACNNIGKAYQDLGRIENAIIWYRKALSHNPDYAEARFNLATAQLLNGDFAEGWTNYEARWLKGDWQRFYPRRLPKPAWDGRPLEGKTILVHSEQGLGDMLQFARYLPMVKAKGGRVVFETRAALIDLFRGWECLDAVMPITPPGADLKVEFDLYVPLLSLPRIFKTDLNSIPRSVPYVAADPERSLSWAPRIRGNGLRVGLVWAGTATDPRRATPLAWFAPWSAIPGVRLFGLQKGPAADLLEREGPPPGMTIDNLGGEFRDFADTAAAIAHLDLVVSIDTSVAHLAGAMGKPVYLLLPHVPDWRWLLGRPDSPWYPSMRLLRQELPDDWSAPMTAAVRRIDTLARDLKLARSASGDSGLAAAAAHFHKQGDAVEASLFYQRLLRDHPDHPEGLHGLGVLAHQAGNHARAIELIARATALSPSVDRYLYHLGLALVATRQYAAAELAFSRAHELNPDWDDARTNRDRVRRQLALRG